VEDDAPPAQLSCPFDTGHVHHDGQGEDDGHPTRCSTEPDDGANVGHEAGEEDADDHRAAVDHQDVAQAWPDAPVDGVEDGHPEDVHDEGEHGEHLEEEEDLGGHRQHVVLVEVVQQVLGRDEVTPATSNCFPLLNGFSKVFPYIFDAALGEGEGDVEGGADEHVGAGHQHVGQAHVAALGQGACYKVHIQMVALWTAHKLNESLTFKRKI